MAIWKCPRCEGTHITTHEWQPTNVFYDLQDPNVYVAPDEHADHDVPGDEVNLLMAGECSDCDYALTDDELALVAKSIDGLVLSGHPRIPVNPAEIKGYVIVNPEHYSGTPVTLGWDEPFVWPDCENQLSQMFTHATENKNEYLYVGMVLQVADFAQIADRYVICKECGEVYETGPDECPECAAWAALEGD